MQLDGIDGRVALVTGGAQGIGRGWSRRSATSVRAVGVDVQPVAVDACAGVVMDVTDEASVDAAFGRWRASWDRSRCSC